MFKGPRYTESELMARLKFTVGLSLAFTLALSHSLQDE